MAAVPEGEDGRMTRTWYCLPGEEPFALALGPLARRRATRCVWAGEDVDCSVGSRANDRPMNDAMKKCLCGEDVSRATTSVGSVTAYSATGGRMRIKMMSRYRENELVSVENYPST